MFSFSSQVSPILFKGEKREPETSAKPFLRDLSEISRAEGRWRFSVKRRK